MTRPIRLSFSPDSDDIFMFWPLLNGKVDAEGLSFVADRADTETLNSRAEGHDQADVIAVSIAQYARVAKDFLLLPHGMSVGRGYGPVVVSTEPRTLASLEGKKVGVPGLRTTAYMVLRLLLEFEPVVVPIAPYARSFEVLRSGEVEAALLIHEGRLFYEREGTHKVVDLGEAWAAATGGLPLPLGGNAIRRDLGPALVEQVSRICRSSIRWALEHKEEVARALLAAETRADVGLDKASLDRYLDMYANADTLDAPADVRRALDELFARGRAVGLLASDARAELAP